MRVLVTGFAGSGVELAFRQVSIFARASSNHTELLSEPYCISKTNTLAGLGASVDATVPLLLNRSQPLHDKLIDVVFPKISQHRVVKAIRGAGRVESYLHNVPDLKVVLCLRNPMDALNSVLHGRKTLVVDTLPERTRLADELMSEPHRRAIDPGVTSELEWLALWWRCLAERFVDLATRYPTRAMLLCYETWTHDPVEGADRLSRFLGGAAEDLLTGLRVSTGPATTARHLATSDLRYLDDHLRYYLDQLLPTSLRVPTARTDLTTQLNVRYSWRAFVLPARQGPGSSDGGPSHARAATCVDPLGSNEDGRMNLKELVRHERDRDPFTTDDPLAAALPSSDLTYGCVVTSSAQVAQLETTLYSILHQTCPFSEVVVVDIGAGLESTAAIRKIAQRHPRIKIVATSVDVGPGAARDLGIAELSTDYVTSVAGGNCLWPTLVAQATEIHGGCPNAIVLAQQLHVGPDGRTSRGGVRASEPGLAMRDVLLESSDPQALCLTYPRQLHNKFGGHDWRLHHGQEWELALRLSVDRANEFRQTSSIGLVVDRRTPEKSARVERFVSRLFAFLKMVRSGALEPAAWGTSFAKCFAQYRSPLTVALYGWFCDERNAARLDVLDEAMTPATALASASNLDRVLRRVFSRGCEWRVQHGFGADEGMRSGFVSPHLYWKIEEVAAIEILADQPCAEFALVCHLPNGPHKLRVGVRSECWEGSASAESRDEPLTVTVPLHLDAGYNLITVVSDRYVTGVKRQGQSPRKLYFILGDVRVPTNV